MLGVKFVKQNTKGLVETFGKYSHSVNSGIHMYIPFFQKIRIVSLAMAPVSLQRYSLITRDNAEVKASVTLNYHVTDAVKYSYDNTDSVKSMEQLVRGHLRDIIGKMTLNEALGSTKQINLDLADAIGDLTNVYGINVDRVNIDELIPSPDIQKAMEQQLTADRKKQAAISQAEGESKSIELTTKAKNEAMIATAKAKAQSTKTEADAEKYRIDTIQSALGEVNDKYFQNQSINAYKSLADSDTNLVVVPSDQANQYGQVPVMKKMLEQGKDNK
ncbi:membrane protein [Philodulcilactobacillus myokoensis]|uniref:Membrane protein n=1 Tax=Philodulcilactobacillus myokoensis TaxID=2929573 RepID=A0A9W6B1E3_9LACO|nr:SPFH domain-containing protein [Philodulcilactobacillus myokoensis]GLB46349.1 membrane protein [Philodulcilactobacillus myokoensis]